MRGVTWVIVVLPCSTPGFSKTPPVSQTQTLPVFVNCMFWVWYMLVSCHILLVSNYNKDCIHKTSHTPGCFPKEFGLTVPQSLFFLQPRAGFCFCQPMSCKRKCEYSLKKKKEALIGKERSAPYLPCGHFLPLARIQVTWPALL